MIKNITVFFIFILLIFSVTGCEDSDLKIYIQVLVGDPEINIKQGDMDISSGDTYAFNTTNIYADTEALFTIENPGNAPLNLTGTERVSISGADAAYFSIGTPPSADIPVNGNSDFTIVFSPIAERTYNATVTILSNVPNNETFTFDVNGPGYIPYSHQIEQYSLSSPLNYDNFGSSVAISGDYAIIGSGLITHHSLSNAGAVVFYHRTGENTWDSGIQVLAPDAAAGDSFGCSVAIDGDYAVIGASGKVVTGFKYGAAYIYQRTGTTTWEYMTTIIPPTTPLNIQDDGANFGASVSISGSNMIIGAPTCYGYGAVAFYNRYRTTWSCKDVKRVPGLEAGSSYGKSVSINGNYAIVGAPNKDNASPAMTDTGAAYIYHYNGSTWYTEIPILPTDPYWSGNFGASVAINDISAIVGAPGYNTNTGSVYMFERTGTTAWDSGTKIVALGGGTYDYFGKSIAIFENYAIVGSYGDGDYEGTAFIYYRSEPTVWNLITTITGEDNQPDDEFGQAVAIDGEHAIIGAPGRNTYQGTAYIFK